MKRLQLAQQVSSRRSRDGWQHSRPCAQGQGGGLLTSDSKTSQDLGKTIIIIGQWTGVGVHLSIPFLAGMLGVVVAHTSSTPTMSYAMQACASSRCSCSSSCG